MLRRDRLIRMQIHQLLDACLFALSFWLAYQVRSNEDIIDLFGLKEWTTPFDLYVKLYLILIPAAPLILEGQGFYARSPPRRDMSSATPAPLRCGVRCSFFPRRNFFPRGPSWPCCASRSCRGAAMASRKASRN